MTIVVAEISANHLGSLDRAIELIHLAADAGANAVKFQAYDPELLCLDHSYTITDGPWGGQKLVDLYHEARTPYCWFPRLFHEVRCRRLLSFASVFDVEGLAMLEGLDCKTYKIASFELIDIPLLEAVAATGKPIILSTGMATYQEIQAAVYAVRSKGCGGLTLLHCVSAYPAKPEDARMGNLDDMRANWSCKVGLSDHSLGNGLAAGAVTLGADMIEKHLTIARSDGGPDSTFSLEPREFKELVENCSEAARGDGAINMSPEEFVAVQDSLVGYGPTVAEQPSLKLRPSLYFAETLPVGTVIADGHIQSARPAEGLPPVCLPDVLGQQLKLDVLRGTPVSWGCLAGCR